MLILSSKACTLWSSRSSTRKTTRSTTLTLITMTPRIQRWSTRLRTAVRMMEHQKCRTTGSLNRTSSRRPIVFTQRLSSLDMQKSSLFSEISLSSGLKLTSNQAIWRPNSSSRLSFSTSHLQAITFLGAWILQKTCKPNSKRVVNSSKWSRPVSIK